MEQRDSGDISTEKLEDTSNSPPQESNTQAGRKFTTTRSHKH